MNKKDRIQRIMQLKEHSDYRSRKGAVHVHGDSYTHFMVKAALFKALQEAGHDPATEVTFRNGFIADVLDATEMIVYEVETNNTDRKTADKQAQYPRIIADVHVLDPADAPTELTALHDWAKNTIIT